MDDFVPMYRDAKNIKDMNWNQGQMIQAFNHGMTKMAKATTELSIDMKWVKRAVFAICGLFGAVVLAAICDSMGWVPA